MVPAMGWPLEHSLFTPRLPAILDILCQYLKDPIGTAVEVQNWGNWGDCTGGLVDRVEHTGSG